jgi:alpha-amylase
MKNKIIKSAIAFAFIGFYSCNQEEKTENLTNQSKVIQITNHDGAPFSTGISANLSNQKYIANPGGGVMMQAFYWDCPAGGNWWNTIGTKVVAWGNAGIGAIWLPPASKAQNGGSSMGYDPTDYFDFGNFNQNGSLETRFGYKSQ